MKKLLIGILALTSLTSFAQSKKLTCNVLAVRGGTCEGALGSNARILSYDKKQSELSESLDMTSSPNYPRRVDVNFYTRFTESSSTVSDKMNIYASVNEKEDYISLTVSMQRPLIVNGEIEEYIAAGTRVSKYKMPNEILEIDTMLCGLMGNSGGLSVNLDVSCQYQ